MSRKRTVDRLLDCVRPRPGTAALGDLLDDWAAIARTYAREKDVLWEAERILSMYEPGTLPAGEHSGLLRRIQEVMHERGR